MTSSRKRAARPGTLHCRTYENLWNSKKKSFRLYWNKENKNSQQKNIYHCFSKEDCSSQAHRDSGANKLSRCAQTMSWKLSHIVWHIDIYWHGTITTGTCRLYLSPTLSCRTEDISQLIDVTVKFVVKIKRKDPIFDCSRTIWIYFLMSISEREKLFRSMMTLTLTCTAHVIQQLSTAKKKMHSICRQQMLTNSMLLAFIELSDIPLGCIMTFAGVGECICVLCVMS